MARSKVELFEQIRRDSRDRQLSIRELAAKHHTHRRTVRQALGNAVPPPRQAYPARRRPVIDRYAEVAVVQSEAGVDIVATSGMMDGQVAVIRDALDEEEHAEVAILAYAAKYASALYGPFREAVDV